MKKQENKTPATPESVWEFLIKLGEEIKEFKEAQRISAEEWKEAQRISAAKSEKEWDEIRKQMKEVRKEIGGIAESNGDMAEATIFNSLERDMTFAGIEFHDIEKNRSGKSKRYNIEGEFDVVMTNGDVVALIETKHKVRKEDVTKFATTQVDNFRKLYPMYDKYEIILGVGGMSFEKGAEAEANKYGIGVIKVVGDKVEYHTEGIRIY